MSAKQDRVAPRTAADIERKYNFGQTFAEYAGLVTDAQKAANDAEAAAKAASDVILKGNKIVVEGQTYLRPTYDDCMAMLRSLNFPDMHPPEVFYDLNGDRKFDTEDILLAFDVFYGLRDVSECVSLEESTVTVTIEAKNPLDTVKISGTNMWGSEVVVMLGANCTNIPVISGSCSIGGQLSVNEYATIPSLALAVGGAPKTLSWKDNGDGTYTLIGTD